MSKIQRLTYVVSQYPAISHTFILGEVNGLTDLGMKVQVASINTPDRPFDKLTAIEQVACQQTVFIKSALLRRSLCCAFQCLKASPKGFLLSLAMVLKEGFSYPRYLLKQFGYWLEALVVAREAVEHGSEHLHAHFSSQGCTVAMLAAQLTGISFSVTVHGPDEFYQVNEFALEKKFAAAKFIICISDFAKSQVMKYTDFSHWDKLHVNYLGVDTSHFFPDTQRQSNPKPVLLCVGRLVNAKGQGVLIKAAELLQARGLAFVVHFVGDGPDREALESFVRRQGLVESVHFLGRRNHDQVQRLQREADVFVLPSFAEGIPIVLMEAMASGTPCVTTHITGIPELFSHEQDGLLVAPGNAKALADALERVLTEPGLSERLSIAARATVVERWCLSRSNARLAAIFQKVLGK